MHRCIDYTNTYSYTVSIITLSFDQWQLKTDLDTQNIMINVWMGCVLWVQGKKLISHPIWPPDQVLSLWCYKNTGCCQHLDAQEPSERENWTLITANGICLSQTIVIWLPALVCIVSSIYCSYTLYLLHYIYCSYTLYLLHYIYCIISTAGPDGSLPSDQAGVTAAVSPAESRPGGEPEGAKSQQQQRLANN